MKRITAIIIMFLSLNAALNAAPGKVTGLTGATGLQVMLNWTATGDEGYTGNVADGAWQINYSSTSNLDPDTAEYAIAFSSDWTRTVVQNRTITGLQASTTYFFWVRARDEQVDNWSVWSDSKSAVSGSFRICSSTFTNLYNGSVAWGDYDNDGDYDIAMSGSNQSNAATTRIYRNDLGKFNDVSTGVSASANCAVAWGDYDGDGDLDIAIAGNNAAAIWRNDNGAFTNIGAGLSGVYNASVAWGDYDNDGDLDLIVQGGSSAKIYRNNNAASFIDIGANLPAIPNGGSAAWGDYDNDGDLDLLSTGGGYSRVYKNTNGVFADIQASFQALNYSFGAWGDYDNDGDLDIALSGMSGSYYFKIYKNNYGTFSEAMGAIGLYYCSLAWGDYDNDGDLDLVVSGYSVNTPNYQTRIYQNAGGVFSEINSGLTGAQSTSVAWCDYNNDGFLDLAITGSINGAASGALTRIYENMIGQYGNQNTAPSIPTGLATSYAIEDTAVDRLTLTWDKSTDDRTASEGMYYNVRMATMTIVESLEKWVISPSTGSGMAPLLGNYPHGYVLQSSTQAGMAFNPPSFDTTYYWQVQSIDTSLKKSTWSAEQSFYVPCSTSPSRIANFAAYKDFQVKLQWQAPDNGANARCGAYLLKYSTSAPIYSEEDFINASTYYQSWQPLSPGTSETYVISGLLPDTTHWFSIKASTGTTWSVITTTENSRALATGFMVVSTLTYATEGSVAWVDYNNDGNLDVAINGTTPQSQTIFKMYRNTGSNFIDTPTGLPSLNTSPAWGDYDGDGDMDMLAPGYYSVCRLYKNTSGMYADSGIVFPSFSDLSSAAWGDFDNDGDLDLVLSGNTGTYVYRNENGSFVDTRTGMPGMSRSAAAWGDYDNDGDLDLIIAGNTGSAATRLYRNDNSSFTLVTTNIADVRYLPSLAWGDCDNDGDLDLAVCGQMQNNSFITRIYRNDAGIFNQHDAVLSGANNGVLRWGDLDNDGDLDLFVQGYNNSYIAKIYRNDLATNQFYDINAGLQGLIDGCADWGDYDNDGDLDLVTMGSTNDAASGAISRVYKSYYNLNGMANEAPSIPTGFAVNYAIDDSASDSLTITWDKSSDDRTPDKGLYYNIRMATRTIADNLDKWVISPTTGAGAASMMGNYSHGYIVASSTQPGFILRPPYFDTTYYWQVQSIDTSFKHSTWSVEQSYYVPISTAPEKIYNLAAYRDFQIKLQWRAPDNGVNARCGSYLIKYSTSGDIATEEEFITASTYYQTWQPLAPGTSESYLLSGLIPDVTYWFSIKASSDTVWSVLSATAANRAYAGYFTYLSTSSIIPLYDASVAWGDYDADNDLDLVLLGQNTSGGTVTKIFKNEQGEFADSGAAGLPSSQYANGSWGDYDNDGDLDLVIPGYYAASKIYKNTGGSFADIGAGLPVINSAKAAWGDYDNDGDLDLIISGSNGGKLYKNTNGAFSDVNANLPSLTRQSLAWGDCDNDGDLDLAIAGYNGTVSPYYYSYVYRNNAGVFSDMGAGLIGAQFSSIVWGDYDNDGDMDLALAGYAPGGRRTVVYKNEASSFTVAQELTGVDYCSLTWGDYDNDGDLDLAVAGTTNGSNTGASVRIYRNNSGVFSDSASGLIGMYYCSIAFGDYDNDGDLDLVTSGSRDGGFTGGITVVYKSYYSLCTEPDEAPTTPANPNTIYYADAEFNDTLTLQWDRSTDDKTLSKGLYYEIRVTTYPLTAGVEKWIVSPSTGLGTAPAMGNYPHGYCIASSTQPGFVLNPPEFGATYYWQARAIDTIGKRSDWCAQQEYYVPLPPLMVTSITPDYCLNYYSVLKTTITGFGFEDGYEVLLRKQDSSDVYATTRTIVNMNKIHAEFPILALATGQWNIVVSTGGLEAENASLNNGLRTETLWISSASPSLGYQTGPLSNVILRGTGFINGTTPVVKLSKSGESDISATGVVVNSTISIACNINITAKATGYWNIEMSTGGAGSGATTMTEGFYIDNMQVYAITPSSGSNITESVISDLYGAGFVTGSQVRLKRDGYSSIEATAESRVSHSKLTCKFNLMGVTTGIWDIEVSTGGASSLSQVLPGAFTVYDTTITAVTPGTAYNNGSFVFETSGDGLLGTLNAYLSKDGEALKAASSFTCVTATKALSTFDLWGAATGYWDIIITSGAYSSYSVRIASAVRVEYPPSQLAAHLQSLVDFDSEMRGDNLCYAWNDANTVKFAKSPDKGLTWTVFTNVVSNTAGNMPSISIDNDGTIYIAYGRSGGAYCKRSTDGGVTFSAEVPIATGDANPDIVVRNGSIYVSTLDTSFVYVSSSTATDFAFGPKKIAADTHPPKTYSCPFSGVSHIAASDSGSKVYLSFTWKEQSGGGALASCTSTDYGNSYTAYSDVVVLLYFFSHDIRATGEDLVYLVGNQTWANSVQLYFIKSANSGANWGTFSSKPGYGSYSFAASSDSIVTSYGGTNYQTSLNRGSTLSAVKTLPKISSIAANQKGEVIILYMQQNGYGYDVLTTSCNPPVQNLTTEFSFDPGPNKGTALISWTAPNFIVGGYDLRYSTSMIENFNFDSATNTVSVPSAALSETNITPFQLTGLTQNVTYYFALKSRNSLGCWSQISNISSGTAIPEAFSDSGYSLTGMDYCSTSWADYNNDAKLDIAMAGNSASGAAIRVYRQETSSFTDVSGAITAVSTGAVAWGDYNCDGYVDLAISGDTGSGYVTKIYRNTGDSFINSGIALTGVKKGAIAWGDWDNDGDLDLALSGESNSGRVSAVYRNDQAVFTDISASIPGVNDAALAWGDYDNDGDLDLAVSGNTGAGVIARVYRNDEGTFSNSGISLTGVCFGSLAWADYDSDGDIDLALTGDTAGTGNSPVTMIYKNENGTMIDSGEVLQNLNYSSLAWGDFDNDGDMDLAAGGKSGALRYTRVYANTSGTFSQAASFDGVRNCSLSFADYDGDSDLDLLVSGNNGTTLTTKLYKSNIFESNGVNNPPSKINAGFSTVYDQASGKYEFHWGDGSDDTTVAKGLYYTIRLSTETPVNDSNARNISWKPVSPFTGNYSHGFCVASSTQPGMKYGIDMPENTSFYWQVRAVDAGLKSGAWSDEQTVFVPKMPPGKITGLTPVPGMQMNLYWAAPGNNEYKYNVSSGTWQIKYSSTAGSGVEAAEFGVDISTAWQKGVIHSYLLTGLLPQTTYSFWIRARDSYEDNWSAWSDTAQARAGSYLDSGLYFIGLDSCAVVWGDYDNDGDLDFAVAGSSDTTSRITKIYRQDAGTFTDIGAALAVIDRASLAWGDYDNDGDLDLAASGYTGTRSLVKLYKNTAGVFNEIAANLNGARDGSLAWGDYDNDGDLDLAVAGSSAALITAAVYRNNGGSSFTNINASVAGIQNCSLAWGDYDNDGDLDLAAGGDTGSGYSLKIYRNNSGTLADSGIALNGINKCALAWGDYDGDGDLDLSASGDTGAGITTILYRNDGGLAFNDSGCVLPGVAGGSLVWGDLNNDGYEDLAIAGAGALALYRSENGSMVLDSYLNGMMSGSLAIGDYDGDFDLDIAAFGYDGIARIGRIYKSYISELLRVNTQPSKLTAGLNASYNTTENRFELRWNAGADAETPEKGLYYTVRAGTTTPIDDVNSSLVSWMHAAPFTGNYPHGFCVASSTQPGVNLILTGVPDDTTFYWQARSIDSARRTGVWSDEQTGYKPVIPPAAITTLTAQHGSYVDSINLSWRSPGEDGWVNQINSGKYRVRFATYVIDSVDFWNTGSWSDVGYKYEIEYATTTAPAQNQGVSFIRLAVGCTFYFRIWTCDGSGHWSELSNGATSWTAGNYTQSNSFGMVWNNQNRPVIKAAGNTYYAVWNESGTVKFNNSDDMGYTWKTPAVIAQGAAIDPGNPAMALDTNGDIYIVYRKNTGTYSYSLYCRRSLNGGFTFEQEKLVHDILNGHSNPGDFDIAVRNGYIYVPNSNSYTMFMSKADTSSFEFTTTTAVYFASGTNYVKDGPHVAASDSGQYVFIVCRVDVDYVGNSVRFYRSTNYGSTFTLKSAYGGTGCYRPHVAAAGENNMYLSYWIDYGGGAGYVQVVASTDTGNTLTAKTAQATSLKNYAQYWTNSSTLDQRTSLAAYGSRLLMAWDIHPNGAEYYGSKYAYSDDSAASLSSINYMPSDGINPCVAINEKGEGALLYLQQDGAHYDIKVCTPAAPGAVASLGAKSQIDAGQAELSWMTPNFSDLRSYDIRYSSMNPLNESNFFVSDAASNPPAPIGAGLPVNGFIVRGLMGGGTYYFAMKSCNKLGKWSPISNLTSLVISGTDAIAPGKITGLSIQTMPMAFRLKWTAPGDNGYVTSLSTPPLGGYVLKYSENPIVTETDFNNASEYIQSWAPNGLGAQENHIITGFTPGTSYYFVIKAYDDAGNLGIMSDSANAYFAGLAVKDFYPRSGVNNASRTLRISGQSFAAGMSAKLKRNGESDITAGSINVISDTVVEAVFNLSGAKPGVWNVEVVKNNETAVLVGQFFIRAPEAAGEWRWEVKSIGYHPSMYDMAAADLNNDGKMELYASDSNGRIWTIKNNGSSWSRTQIADEGSGSAKVLAVGDGDNDKELELYAAGTTRVFQYKYNGSSWARTIISTAMASATELFVGDGNNDGLQEVYVVNDVGASARVYQLSNTDNAWALERVTEPQEVTDWPDTIQCGIGDGDNDGVTGLYINRPGVYLYQSTCSAGVWSSTGMAAITYGKPIVCDADNDGLAEVYMTKGQAGGTYQVKYDGAAWIKTKITATDCNSMVCADMEGTNTDELYRSIGTGVYVSSGPAWPETKIGTCTITADKIVNADTNGDGAEELLAFDIANNYIYIYQRKPVKEYDAYYSMPIYNDSGASGSVGVWQDAAGSSLVLTTDFTQYKEGKSSFKNTINVVHLDTYGGAVSMFISGSKQIYEYYDNGGYLEFAIRVTSPVPQNMLIELRSSNISADTSQTQVYLEDYITDFTSGTWHTVRIPLEHFYYAGLPSSQIMDFSNVVTLFNLIYKEKTSRHGYVTWAGTAWIDDVKFYKPDNVSSIQVVPDAAGVYPGLNRSFSARYTNFNGDSVISVEQATWTVSNADKGSVSPEQGHSTVFTASSTANNGDICIITAQIKGMTDTALVTISTQTWLTSYSIYNDTGLPYGGDISMWEKDWEDNAQNASYLDCDELNDAANSVEGSKFMRDVVNSAWGGFGVVYTSSTRDLSNFSGGDLKFWVKTPINLKVEMQDTDKNGAKKTLYIEDYGWDVAVDSGVWTEVSIPMVDFLGSSGVDATKIYAPFMISAENLTSLVVFDVDYVKLVTNATSKGPSKVQLINKVLYVDDKPFTVKGVATTFTPAGQSNAYDWAADSDTYSRDLLLMKAMGANVIRLYDLPSDQDVITKFYEKGIYTILTYYVSPSDVINNPAGVQEGFLSMVNTWKMHPGILAWCLGNEVSMQKSGDSGFLQAWYTLVNNCAKAAHEAEAAAGITYHPVTTAYGELQVAPYDKFKFNEIGNSSYKADDASLAYLDFWSLNIYVGKSFGTFFDDYLAKSNKPLLLSEWGCDAYDGRDGYKTEQQQRQSDYEVNQWKEILSTGVARNICFGGVLFMWRDNWAKSFTNTLGDAGHDTSTDYNAYAYDDPNVNEEWWGIVGVSTSSKTYRQLRSAYGGMRQEWNPGLIQADILNIADDSAADKISWGQDPSITNQWQASGQYLRLQCAPGFDSWGLQVYTDNCAADANPQFFILNPSSYNPAGLVRAADGKKSLKMCWRITDNKLANTPAALEISENQVGTAVQLYNPTLGSAYPCWVWMKDRKSPSLPLENALAFEDGEDYITAWESYRGFQHAEGTWASGDSSPNYVYFGAKLGEAIMPNVYRTNKLTVEFFIE